jgi:hypothetical protein
MAFSSTTIEPVAKTNPGQTVTHDATASLLSAIVLSVYAAQKGRKNFRKMKRHFMWTAFKLKLKSLFSKQAQISNRTLIYILIGVIALVLIFIAPLAALIVALTLLILILAGVI